MPCSCVLCSKLQPASASNMAIRFTIQAVMALMQTMLHCIFYSMCYVLYQLLNGVEMTCWYIDTCIEEHLQAHPQQPELPPGSAIPAHLRYIKSLFRFIWSYIMWAISMLHVSHSICCESSGHQLPNEVTFLAQYYLDHAHVGPCADYNFNR